MTSISSHNEELLRQLVAQGRFSTEHEALAAAIRLLQEQSAIHDAANCQNLVAGARALPPDKWLEQFYHWTRRTRKGNPHLDDSRDTIYGDRA